MKKFIRAFFTITIFTVLTKILSFLLKVFLSRKIGAESIGMIQVAVSVCSIFATLSSSGINVIVSKQISEKYEKNLKRQSFSIVTASIIIGILISLISTSVLLIFSDLIKNITSNNTYILILYLIPSIIAVSISSAICGYLWGRKKYFSNCLIDFFEQFARTVLCVILLYSVEDRILGARIVAITMSVSCVLAMILALVMYVKSDGKLVFPKKKNFEDVIKQSAPITLVRFINSFTHPAIAIIVPLKLESSGFTYSQAMSMFGIMQSMTMSIILIPMMLITALSTILIPDLVRLYSKKYFVECNTLVNVALSISLFVCCLILPLFAALGEPIGKLLFDNVDCGIYLSKSAWIIIPCAFVSVTSAILNVLNFEKKSSRNSIISTIILLVLSFVLPKYFDILCIPLSLGISMSVTAFLNILVIKKELKFTTDIIKNLIKFVSMGIPVYIISKNLFDILTKYFRDFFSLIISSLIGLLFYLILCYVFKIINVNVVTSLKKNTEILEKV